MSRFSKAALAAVVVVVALAPVSGTAECSDPGDCVTTLYTFWGLPLGSAESLAWIPAVLVGAVVAVYVFRKSKKRPKRS